MASEKALWQHLSSKLPLQLKMYRLENLVALGWADVNYIVVSSAAVNKDKAGISDIVVEGWIELKQRDAWPKRERTPVKIGLRDEQKDWLTERWYLTQRAYILVQIGREYLLLAGRWAKECETWEQRTFREHALCIWEGGIDKVELAKELGR